jgi:hypothetical protein
MVVQTQTEEVRRLRRTNLELIFSDHNAYCLPPCQNKCPSHIDIPGFLKANAEGEFRESARIFKRTIPFPSILGRVCPAPCEEHCRRDEVDEAIAIRDSHRYAGDIVLAAQKDGIEPPLPFDTEPKSGKRVAVVGSGPAGMAAAYYMLGAIDGSRKGTYFLNTSKPEERHRYGAEDMAFHEAVPGHHFQLTIAMESEDLPAARRVLSDTACAEGWGLYSERLADEMGLYSDDLARMGLFAADSWRASRLVVDTGLHALGWKRQEAIDWMTSHTPLPRIEIESEVDRYISYPGQALAYMVGRREIVRLRTAAADTLGARFDLREFHDLVLRAGILPLPALARTVERWVERVAS